MPEPRTFLMGKYPAELPGDLLYCKNHMWCRPVGNGRLRFGFSAYAIRLMQDVYFLDWTVDDGTPVTAKQEIGHIETSKATSDLFAPMAGVVAVINRELMGDPSAINVEGYGVGWLFEMDAEPEGTMDVDAYYEHLEAGWEVTQRLLKGQINQ